ncbi:MAG: alpha/beta fold hydrolase, partial [Acidimicrobiales bacterium]
MRLVPTGGGVEIAVHELGSDRNEGDGPDIVLIHAAGLHARTWAPLVRHLDGRRAIGLDVRGHGHSTDPPGPSFAWPDLAADVIEALAALD